MTSFPLILTGITPLHDAATNGHLEVIQLLLDNGASAIAKNDDGETPLHILKNWRAAVFLDEPESALYDSIVRRMTTTLEKSGHSTDIVLSNKKSKALVVEKPRRLSKDSSSDASCLPTKRQTPQKKTKKPTPKKATPVKTQIGNARRSLEDPTDDFDVSSSFCSSSVRRTDESNDPTHSYKQVMLSLRHSGDSSAGTLKKRKSNDLPKQSAFIPADDMDDWLEDDLNVNTTKKRKTSLTENLLYSSNVRNQPSGHEKPESSRSFGKASSRSSVSDSDTFECDTEAIEPPVGINVDDYDDDFVASSFSNVGRNKRKTQVSLIDVGFSRYKTPPKTQRRIVSQQCKPKVTPLLDLNAFREAPVPSSVANMQQTVVESMLSVDIRIDGRLYRVPMSQSEMRTCSIKWLAEEASKRYFKYVFWRFFYYVVWFIVIVGGRG